MLNEILNPTVADMAAMLACISVGIFAGVAAWFPKSAFRARLQAEQLEADRRAEGQRIRAELRTGGR